MIAQHVIDKIFDVVDVYEIISQFVELKKSGSSYKGLSPFSNENSPSFYVVPSKQIWKDFSSGKGGHTIKFLMESESMDYREALKFLANHYGIELEEESEDMGQRESREKAQYFSTLNHAAQIKYTDQLVAILKSDEPDSSQKYWDQINRFDMDTISQWQLGLATRNGKLIYDAAREKGKVQDCEAVSLIVNKQGSYYDFFYERLIFPIHDRHQRVIAFGGRAYQDSKIKYLNSKESILFKKDQHLYGLAFAQKAIKSGVEYGEEIVFRETAILQEGYTDVISFHAIGLNNAVATLGTAISDTHCKLLKRVAKTVLLLRDGDMAGIRAMERDTLILLKHGFKVELALLEEDEDPDSLANELKKKTTEWLLDNRQDALIYFATKIYNSASDAYDRATAVDRIVEMIRCIPDDFIQNEYRKTLTKELKLTVSQLKSREEKLTEKEKIKQHSLRDLRVYDFEGSDVLPQDPDLADILKQRFFGKVEDEYSGYYMLNKDLTNFYQVSNFTFTPILHKYDPDDNSRILKLENGIDEPEVIELASDALMSPEKFRTQLFNRGPYHFYGSKADLDKIVSTTLHKFPKGYELKNLGWQNEGFFAYFDCIYIPSSNEIKQYDDAGLVKFDYKYYFSPASSNIFKEIRQDGSDAFEKDRYLTYTPAPINFEEWSDLMFKVYDEHAYAGVPYVFISLFRDLVFNVDNNCPHLYCYGPSKSGKSKFGESIANIFFKGLKPFAMSSGTDAAFAAALDRYINCPMIFNEFDESTVKEERFQAVKTAYDGEGRERLGRGTNKMKSHTQKVNCSMILLGQFLATKDDNSVPSRSILRTFKLNYDRTEEQTEFYNHLKKLERDGLGGLITQLLPYRQKVEDEYNIAFIELFKTLNSRIRDRRKQFDERVLRNYTALAAMNKLFADIFSFPWSHEDYLDWAEKEVIELSTTIAQSDVLKDFWLTVQNLADKLQVQDGLHYKLIEKKRLRVNEPETADGYLDLTEASELLYIRISEVQKLYAKEKRSEGGIPMNITSLMSYIKTRSYFVGNVNSEDIGGKKYSCYILRADELGVNLGKPEIPFHPGTSVKQAV